MIKAVCLIISLHTMIYSVNAQNTTRYEWQQRFELQSIQGDFTMFLLDWGKAAITVSLTGAADLDFSFISQSDSRTSIGVRLGITRFDWPDLDREEKYVNSDGYSAIDYDLLARYTYLTSYFRYDLLAGLSVRDGKYYEGRFIDGELIVNALQVSPGLKLGGEMMLMLLKPVLALRLKGSMFFFGYKPIEAGAIGLGLVLGWQRDPD
jgi:hypothetical protein